MTQNHKIIKDVLISGVALVTLMLTSNPVFAKGRLHKARAYRPKTSRTTRIIRHRPTIKKQSPKRHRNRMAQQNRRQPRRRRSNNSRNVIRMHKTHKTIKRNNIGGYNIFKNTPPRQFKVLKNSTRTNTRSPKMRTLTIFPNVYRGGRWPQSLNVDQKGHYAYLGFDSFANDGSKVIRYNLYRHHFNGTGRTFSGGHAQAVSADHRNNLWFVNRTSNDESGDHQGPINKGSFVEVSPRSLKPIYHKYFRFGRNYMGDNLAFAGKYGVFNLSRIMGRNHTSNQYHRHMLVFYHSNELNRHGSQWSQVGAIRNTPGDFTIQAVSYNPRNQRLYVGSSDPTDLMSFPVQRILSRTLRKRDVRIASLRLSSRREIEGLAFDHKGYMYMLLGSPGQLMRSHRPVTK